MPETRVTARLFDRVAPRYDLLNRLMSLGQDARWRARLVAALQVAPGARVLDVGCGTGDVTLALAAAGAHPVGLDPSREMLRRARAKSPSLAWVQGDALRLPFKDRSFAAASSSFVLRNLPDRAGGFAEQARVLAPGARAAHLELVRPPAGWRRALHTGYIKVVIPAMGWLSSDRRAYRYLAGTILAVPQPEVFAEELAKAGLDDPRVERMAGGGVALVMATKPR